jgi:hypothetical protein
MTSARLTPQQDALLHALGEVVEQCRNVIDAYESRADDAVALTLNEGQEIAVLWIRMEDLKEVRLAGRAEAS